MAGKRKQTNAGLPPLELQVRMKEAEEKFGMSSKKFDENMTAAQHQASHRWQAHLRREKKQKTRAQSAAAQEQAHRQPDAQKEARRLPALSTTFKQREGSAATPTSATTPITPTSGYEGEVEEPQKDYSIPPWYTKVNPKGLQMKLSFKNPAKRQILTALSSMKECLSRCEVEKKPSLLASLFNDLRDHVHKAEFLAVDEYTLVRAHMLDNGLARIFDAKGTVEFPWDLKEDSLQLYLRWAEKNFSVELLRGIVTSKKKDDNRSADKIDSAWRKKFSHLPTYYGSGRLVLGQWWPTQLCTVRDGAHGTAQGGIFGQRLKGAYSIVVAGNSSYEDKDDGDELLYCGTESKDATPTENTMRMIESCDVVKQPVRVIRSANLPLRNPYRPVRGYRYDGLYVVVSYEVMKPEKAVYRFRLIRCKAQQPIRYEKDKPSSRPTKWEIEAYDKEVVERGFGLATQARK